MKIKKDELIFIADTLLIDKLSMMDASLRKEAGITDTLRDAAAAAITEIKSEVEKNGYGALISFFMPTIFWRIHPVLGIVYLAAQALGIHIDQILIDIVKQIKESLDNDEPLSFDKIDNIGKSVGEQHIGEPLDSRGSDMLFYLRKIDSEKQIMKVAAGSNINYLTRLWSSVPYFSSYNKSLLGKLINIGGARGKWIIVGIVIWFVKTILAGVGLLAAGAATKSILGIKPQDGPPDEPHTENKIETDRAAGEKASGSEYARRDIVAAKFLPLPVRNGLKINPSYNEVMHNNIGNNYWALPLINRNLRDTLIKWSTEIYPELVGHEAKIISNAEFNKTVSILSKFIPPEAPGTLMVPEGIMSRKQIVDYFAGYVERDIKNTEVKP